ncbi:hypothetical protein [Amycolatopsis magusensis]|uniref:hypothetical protein n=1 Tax=Amycolatopsis magusensis TaxID=882444 RepID=UPI0037B81D80
MVDDSARAALRWALSADAFVGEMRRAFCGTEHEVTAKKRARRWPVPPKTPRWSPSAAGTPGLEAERKLARARANFVQQHLPGH